MRRNVSDPIGNTTLWQYCIDNKETPHRRNWNESFRSGKSRKTNEKWKYETSLLPWTGRTSDNDRIFLRNFYPDTQNPVTQDNPIVPRMIPEIPQIVPLYPRTFRSPKMNHGSGKYNNLPRKELHTWFASSYRGWWETGGSRRRSFVGRQASGSTPSTTCTKTSQTVWVCRSWTRSAMPWSARWTIFSNTHQIRRDLASLTDSITKNGDTWPCCNTIRPRRGAVSTASLLSYTHNKTHRSLSILFSGIRLL